MKKVLLKVKKTHVKEAKKIKNETGRSVKSPAHVAYQSVYGVPMGGAVGYSAPLSAQIGSWGSGGTFDDGNYYMHVGDDHPNESEAGEDEDENHA